MQHATIHRGDAGYPSAVALHLGDKAPAIITACGNLDILHRKALALFGSIKCPGDLIVQTYDLARGLRDGGATVAGGFHAPMEKECLSVLLRGTQSVILCPARGIEGMRVPAEWQAPLANGRLLLLSPFAHDRRRVTADLARARNLFLAALAETVLIAQPCGPPVR